MTDGALSHKQSLSEGCEFMVILASKYSKEVHRMSVSHICTDEIH